ncbi:MAG TPA: YcxB family protein [Actinoplanes sp.]|nr:YcxB family protein [Actinoplanes sp.]
MHIEFAYARTPEYFRNKFQPEPSRAAVLLHYLVIPIVFLALFILVFGGLAPKAVLTGGGLIVLAVVVAVLSRTLARRAARISTRPADGMLTLRTWVLTDELMASHTTESSAEFTWSSFTSLWTMDDAYVLRTAAGRAIDIPREPLTPEQDTELNTFLTALPIDRQPLAP